jgi:hypothetical protein
MRGRFAIVLVLLGVVVGLTQPAVSDTSALAPSPSDRLEVPVGSRGVAVDPSGDLYATGSVRRGGGDEFMVVRRFAGGRRLVWERRWRMRELFDSAGEHVDLGTDGMVYVSGWVANTTQEGHGWFLRKYTPRGRLLWTRTTRGWRDHAAEAISDLDVSNDMVVVSGYGFGCCADPYRDGWVRAYDLDGRLLWTNSFEAPGIRRVFFDQANGIAIGKLDGVYVGGWVQYSRQRDPEADFVDRDVIVQKLSPSGDVLWSRVLRDRGRDHDAVIDVSVKGDVLVATASLNDRPVHWDRPHSWLARFTFDGELLWAREWGWENRRAAVPAALSVSPWGATYVVGKAQERDRGPNLFVRKYAPRGRLLWASAIDRRDQTVFPDDVTALSKGAYVAGYAFRNASWNEVGAWIWRFAA